MNQVANNPDLSLAHNLHGGASFITHAAAIPTVQFDGFTFAMGMNLALPFLEMAYRARRGDPVAAEMLTSFRVTIHDQNSKSYWPMEPKAEESVTALTPSPEEADTPYMAVESSFIPNSLKIKY